MSTLKPLVLVLLMACVSPTEPTINVRYPVFPVLKGKAFNPVAQLTVEVGAASTLSAIRVEMPDETLQQLSKVSLVVSDEDQNVVESKVLASQSPEKSVSLEIDHLLAKGKHVLWVTVDLHEDTNVDEVLRLKVAEVTLNDQKVVLQNGTSQNRLGVALRQHGQDGIDTYRIPGLATTNNGTLIGVYDNRRNSATDLQGDIDVAMSRSTDGGRTWEPMQVIMDMGEWGGLPEDQNGIGDPSILVDETTGTIWVAAVWAHGHPDERNWYASKPGMKPLETSQFVLVRSDDDGLTWSDPINITQQIKRSEWHLLLAGPGKGITMKDGTLVFPAQYKDANEIPHSTLIYSVDHGQTWGIGTGVREETTEAQLVELEAGILMINCRNNEARDALGVGRVVATTEDLGATWEFHPTNIRGLEEPTCMASLVNESFGGEQIMLFSNPNAHDGRYNLTIKYSPDQGDTWPEAHWLLLDEGRGRGYSCLTKIDEQTLGILYEGSQSDLVFQRVRVEDIFN